MAKSWQVDALVSFPIHEEVVSMFWKRMFFCAIVFPIMLAGSMPAIADETTDDPGDMQQVNDTYELIEGVLQIFGMPEISEIDAVEEASDALLGAIISVVQELGGPFGIENELADIIIDIFIEDGLNNTILEDIIFGFLLGLP